MSVLRLIIYGNLLVSYSAGMLTFAISKYQGFEHSLLHGMCAFFATLFIYNLQRLMRFEDVKVQKSTRHEWLVKNKSFVIFLCVSGVIGAFLSYITLGVKSDIFLVLGLSIVGFLYAYKGLNTTALREVPFIKIYLISVVWTLDCVLWPAYRQESLNGDTLYLMISVGVYILAATIPFDIRDLVYDKSSQKTVPQLIGVGLSKALGLIALIVSALTLYKLEDAFSYSVLFYFAYVGMGLLVLLSSTKRKEMFFSGLIDGWISILAFAFYIASI